MKIEHNFFLFDLILFKNITNCVLCYYNIRIFKINNEKVVGIVIIGLLKFLF